MTQHFGLSVARPALRIVAGAGGRLTDKQAIAFAMRFASAKYRAGNARGCVRIMDSAPPMPAVLLPIEDDDIPF